MHRDGRAPLTIGTVMDRIVLSRRTCPKCGKELVIENDVAKKPDGDNIVGTSDENRDQKLDSFIVEQAANPLYADCLQSRAPAQKQKAELDPHKLTLEQFKEIAAHGISR